MTRKDYQVLACALAATRTTKSVEAAKQWLFTVEQIVETLEATFPNFNPDIFLDWACVKDVTRHISLTHQTSKEDMIMATTPFTCASWARTNQKNPDHSQRAIVEKHTFVNGIRIDNYTDDDLFSLLATLEKRIGELKKLNTNIKSSTVNKKIDDLQRELDTLVAVIDNRKDTPGE